LGTLWYGNDRIAYVTEHGEDGYQLIDLDGKTAGQLRMPPGCDSLFHQCLSPDGKTVAFCGNHAEVDQKFENNEDRRRYLNPCVYSNRSSATPNRDQDSDGQ
jgi:hypothetical protein